MKTKLTDKSVQHLAAPEKGFATYWDALLPGFGLRVSYGGTRSFVVQARVLKKGRWVDQCRTLGRYPALKLADARANARTELEAAQEGKQLGATKIERKEAQLSDSRNTFGAVLGEFLQKYRTRWKSRPRDRTLDEIRRALTYSPFDAWQDRPLAQITRRDVMDALDVVTDRGAERMANADLRYLKMLFGWALDRDIIDTDPTNRIKPPGREQSRERVLEKEELRRIWESSGTGVFADILKVLMLTGQRVGETTQAQWGDIDWEGALWRIPGSRTKNRRDHLVPLAAPVLGTLRARQEEQRALRLRTDLVFTLSGDKPFNGHSQSKARVERRAGTAHWTLHDLRRTCATRMAEDLQVAPHVVEAVLNHVSGVKSGVAGIYNRALYLDERRKALDAWADYVLSVVGEDQ
jgi:integrase